MRAPAPALTRSLLPDTPPPGSLPVTLRPSPLRSQLRSLRCTDEETEAQRAHVTGLLPRTALRTQTPSDLTPVWPKVVIFLLGTRWLLSLVPAPASAGHPATGPRRGQPATGQLLRLLPRTRVPLPEPLAGSREPPAGAGRMGTGGLKHEPPPLSW